MSVLSLPTNAMAQPTEARLSSNRTQLEALWQHHAQLVYTLALQLLANADDAETITAEVFQCAQQQWPELQGNERRRLLQWTIGMALSWLRRHERLLIPNENDSSPLKITAAASRLILNPVALETQMLQLPDYWRVVFVLRDVMGLSNQEIAAYLQTEEGQIRQAIHSARLALREALQEKI